MRRSPIRQTFIPRYLAWITLLLGLSASSPADDEIRYDGVFNIRDNGDIHVSTTLTMPMAQYEKMRQGVGNLYLLMRSVASHRANAEIVNKKAEWDDANRRVTFTMTWLGAAQNAGDHWEVTVPRGTTFSNIDEGRKTLHFYATAQGPMGTVNGQEHLVLPLGVKNLSWDDAKRVVRYEMPLAHLLIAMDKTTLWGLAAALLVIAAILGYLSLRSETQPPARGQPSTST